MPDAKMISELTTAEQTTANDLFETAIPNALSSTGYLSRKVTASELANLVANVLQYTNNLNTTAKTLTGAINELFADGNIAEEYDSTATYAIGDFCIYNGTLYKCTTAVSTAEAFDSTKWSATVVVDELGSGGGASWVDVTGTLTAGSTSITLSNASITNNSTIDVYVDESFLGVVPTSQTTVTGSVTLTFEEQGSNMPVKVRVS